jgi:hypothetical protein
MKNSEYKLMIIENYIEWYTSSDKERDKLKDGASCYVKEDYTDEIESALEQYKKENISNSYPKNFVERRIKFALEDLDKVRTKISVELLGEDRFDEVWTSLNNIQIALDFNSDEADTWKLSSELYVCEYDIEFSAPELGSQTSDYDFKCYDGYATANNGILELKVSYPKISEMNENQKLDCLEYRYGSDASKYNIHFGDVMMCKGKLESFKVL